MTWTKYVCPKCGHSIELRTAIKTAEVYCGKCPKRGIRQVIPKLEVAK